MFIKSNLYKKIVIFSFSIFIFFFDFLRDYLDFRLVIFIPFFIALYESFLSQKKINYKIFFLFFFLLILFTLQVQFQEINLQDKIYSFKTIIFFGITTFTIWYFSDYILKNIDLLFNFFLIFGVIYILFFTIYKLDLHIAHHQCYVGCFSIFDDKLQFFKENSHIGFISSTLISYMIIKTRKVDIYFFSLILFYIFIVLNFSLTIFFALLLILLYFFIFYYTKFNIYQKILVFFLIFFTFYILNINASALDRLNSLIKIDNWQVHEKDVSTSNIKKIDNDEKETTQVNEKATTQANKIKKTYKEKLKDENNNQLDIKKEKNVKNLSSEVFIVSLNVAKVSILEKPFGYGLNNYHLAFKKHINEIEVTNKMTKKLNIFDASNNLAKLITELGIFSILIFFLLITFLLSKKISFEYKFLIFPALFVQTFIRGAGYFNGGYILFLVLSCYLLYKSKD